MDAADVAQKLSTVFLDRLAIFARSVPNGAARRQEAARHVIIYTNVLTEALDRPGAEIPPYAFTKIVRNVEGATSERAAWTAFTGGNIGVSIEYPQVDDRGQELWDKATAALARARAAWGWE